MFASVLLPIPFCRRVGPLTYVAEGSVRPGEVYLAPFGKQVHRGVVVAVSQALPAGVDRSKLRELHDAAPELHLSPERLAWAQWTAHYYHAPLLEVLRLLLPGEVWTHGLPELVSEVVEVDPAPPARLLEALQRAPAQRAAYELLAARTKLPLVVATVELGIPRDRVLSLQARGLLRVVREELPPPAFASVTSSVARTPAQDAALAGVFEGPGAENGARVSLLHGVTGSGKTEVYLAAMERVLTAGRGAIFLVPEIALTPQTIGRIEARFPNSVAVVHSGLTDHQRAMAWSRAARGHARVVVGPRSALFAPVKDLGLIVIDEEHEGTYKQDSTPRYHARTCAFDLARRLGIPLLLGSATPAVETYHAAVAGRIHLLQLPERVSGKAPRIEVVDLRAERAAGGRSALSDQLLRGIEETWKAGRQTILFLNRRGLSPVLQCRGCGEVLRCSECSVSLTVHRRRVPQSDGTQRLGTRLLCHICGQTPPIPAHCPACHLPQLQPIGTGTQRLEEELQERFPGIRIARADRDTTQGVEAHGRIYDAVVNREVDVLVGTQMIAKGLDLPAVDLVGIVLADQGLARPDFRATEQTVSLLTQVAGRAGRRGDDGRVILQTYAPDSPAVRAVVANDMVRFLKDELLQREAFGYPPYARYVKLALSRASQELADAGLQLLASKLAAPAAAASVEVRGPIPAGIAKRRGMHTSLLLLRAKERAAFEPLLHLVPPEVQVDVDPGSLE